MLEQRALLMKSWFLRHKWDLIVILALLVSYAIIYRDVLFAPYVITGVDFQIPSPTPLIPWNGLFTSWGSASLGSPYGIGWTGYAALLNGFFALFSGGNLLLAQKFMLLGIFFASVFMYIFLASHITKVRIVAFACALIYAYGPVTLNFGTGLIWELAFFPLVLTFVFNIIGSKPRLRDAAFLAISLDFLTGYGIHLFVFIPIIFAVFLLLNLWQSNSKLVYLKKTLKYSLLGIIFFALSAPAFSLTVMSFLPIPQLLPAQSQASFTLASAANINQFYLNYCSVNFSSWFTQSFGLIQSLVPFIGFLFPIIALSSLIIVQKKATSEISFGSLVGFHNDFVFRCNYS